MSFILNLTMAVSLTLFSTASLAGPNASGGVPETAFERDRAAVQTVLEAKEIWSMSRAGKLRGIFPDRTRPDVYIVLTEKCELHMQFHRSCDTRSGLPQCESKATPIWETSRGDCKN